MGEGVGPSRSCLGARVVRLVAAGFVTGSAALSMTVFPASTAGAATDTVFNCNSSGPGSLPAVVAAASSGDTVTFALSPPCSTITLAGPIDISTNLTIVGPGASTLAVSEGSPSDVFDVASTATAATISGLTVEDGSTAFDNAGTLTVEACTLTDNGTSASGGIVNKGTLTVTGSTLSDNGIGAGNGFGGGAIFNDKGTVTITDTTLLDNAAANAVKGGGIYNNDGSVNISGSTLSGNNTGDGDGGAIYNRGGTVTITASTLAGNTAVDGNGGAIDNDTGTMTVTDSTLIHNKAFYNSDGGGIYNGGKLTVSNSTLSTNDAMYGGVGGDIFNGATTSLAASIVADSTAGGDCSGTITDGGYNLDDDGTCGLTASTDVSDTPAGLDPAGLGDNGGPTRTIALEPTSPAIGAVGDTSLCSTPDQRGTPRPTPCDIGAVEFALPPQAITSPDDATAAAGKPFSFAVTTSGQPAPSLTTKGKLPKHVKLVKTGAGTATISGTPIKTGVYTFMINATFGKGKGRYVASQAFTLTVDSVSQTLSPTLKGLSSRWS